MKEEAWNSVVRLFN